MDTSEVRDAGAVVPASVRQLVASHLRELDQAAPGLVEALYLTGSVALGDYRDGVSDVDFLAVTSRPVTGEDADAVAAAHLRLPASPHLDGIYLDRRQFAAMPDDERNVPHSVGGQFRTGHPCGELNPVSWLTIARCGIAVRGQATADLGLRVDAQRLHEWNLGNLTGYWRPLADQIRQAIAERTDDAPANPVAVVWAVLGPARLHYTLATGEVTSKTGAGRWVERHFPAGAELARRAVAWRNGEHMTFVTADGRDAAAMVDAVVADALRRWG